MRAMPVPTAPIDGEAVLPLALAKQHLSVDGDEQDDLITLLRDTAIEWIELATSRGLTVREWTEQFAGFGAQMVLSRRPVLQVSAIRYLDGSGLEVPVEDGGWRVTDDSLVVAAGRRWPSALSGVANVTVSFTAGYDAQTRPKPLVAAAMLLLAHLFKNREAVVVGATPAEMPFGVVVLCSPYRAGGV